MFAVFYRKVTALKKFGVKVLLAIGGWNDSAGSKYSELVNNPFARTKFVEHVVDYLKQNDFDGLDFDWEYPKCWQVINRRSVFKFEQSWFVCRTKYYNTLLAVINNVLRNDLLLLLLYKQVDCKRGPKSDKEGFSRLLLELREAFNKEGFLLSAAVSPNKVVIDAGKRTISNITNV